MESIRERIAADLKQAMRDRDTIRVSVLRTTLSTLANAEAVDVEHSSLPVRGLFATEAERREITDDDVIRLLRAERDEFRASAAEYAELGRTDDAAELEAKAAVLDSYLNESPSKSPDDRHSSM